MVDQRGTRRKRNWTTVALAVLVIGAGLVTAFPAASAADPSDCTANQKVGYGVVYVTADVDASCLGCSSDTVFQVGLIGTVAATVSGCAFPDCTVVPFGAAGWGDGDDLWAGFIVDCGSACYVSAVGEADIDTLTGDTDSSLDCEKPQHWVL